jgi:hypothetical protein
LKTYHESPLSIFKGVQQVTDGDYALVHLFETNPIYFQTFKDAVNMGREVILDNSLFELGESFDPDRYAYWIEELLPTWYIVPDTLGDGPDTIKKFDSWMSKYGDLPGKKIAVAQGKTMDELIDCYKYLIDKVDMISISFGNEWFIDNHPILDFNNLKTTKYHSYMCGRIALIVHMEKYDIIDKSVPHHLLGCGLPQEFKAYKDDRYNFITSVDTSNPIVHGMKGIRYNDSGLEGKESMLMCDAMNDSVGGDKLNDIMYNILMFREFCNGGKLA